MGAKHRLHRAATAAGDGARSLLLRAEFPGVRRVRLGHDPARRAKPKQRDLPRQHRGQILWGAKQFPAAGETAAGGWGRAQVTDGVRRVPKRGDVLLEDDAQLRDRFRPEMLPVGPGSLREAGDRSRGPGGGRLRAGGRRAGRGSLETVRASSRQVSRQRSATESDRTADLPRIPGETPGDLAHRRGCVALREAIDQVSFFAP